MARASRAIYSFVPRDLLDGWDRGTVTDEELLAYVRDTLPVLDTWVMRGNLVWSEETPVPIARRLGIVHRIVRMIERRAQGLDPR